MAVLLGLGVAACFGSGDFFGGVASRRAHMVSVLGVAQLFAVVGAIIATLVFSGGSARRPRPRPRRGSGRAQRHRAWQALYQGLALGRMGIVAPVTAVVGTCVPVVYGLATGERPSALTLVGVALAVGAGGLIAREHDTDASGSARRALLLTIGAGLLFGWSFVLLPGDRPRDSGFWPTLSGRAAAVVIVVTVALVSGAGLRLPPAERRLAVAAGVLDIGGRRSMLLVAVHEDLSYGFRRAVATLGPTFTVAWAWAISREPVTRLQVAGLGVALVGLVLITARVSAHAYLPPGRVGDRGNRSRADGTPPRPRPTSTSSWSRRRGCDSVCQPSSMSTMISTSGTSNAGICGPIPSSSCRRHAVAAAPLPGHRRARRAPRADVGGCVGDRAAVATPLEQELAALAAVPERPARRAGCGGRIAPHEVRNAVIARTLCGAKGGKRSTTP